jgi:ABC-type transport system substrate-binding protein
MTSLIPALPRAWVVLWCALGMGFVGCVGPESNTVLNYFVINRLVYEPLLWLHPTTLEFIPALATHWQISPDKMTYRFRINPNARWSDGEPVVADDVVATWTLIMDKGLQAPMDQLVFEKFEKPVAESKYIVPGEIVGAATK